MPGDGSASWEFDVEGIRVVLDMEVPGADREEHDEQAIREEIDEAVGHGGTGRASTPAVTRFIHWG